MKVLYTIYSNKGKPGGHFFSFEHTTTAMNAQVDVVVLYVGHTHPVIEKLPFKIYHVGKSIKECSEIRNIIKSEKPDVVHCFDGNSYKYILLSSIGLHQPVVMTIPGGNPNPQNIPYCKDIILFSEETMASFGKCNRFKDCNLSYMPNRVNKAVLNTSKVCENNVFTFLQIIRIQPEKHLQIQKTLHFLKKLVTEGISAKLILAGTVNNESEKDFIEHYISDNNLQGFFTLITDERVYHGSDLLPLADCVIATGRSTMEASALGKNVLVPVKNLDYPVLLDKDNFESLFYFNFSGRTTKTFSEEEFDKIKRIISDSEFRKHANKFVEKISNEYFEFTNEIIRKYRSIYSEAKPVTLINFFMNIKVFATFAIRLLLRKN